MSRLLIMPLNYDGSAGGFRSLTPPSSSDIPPELLVQRFPSSPYLGKVPK